MKKKCVITANWKMYKTVEEGVSFLQEFLPAIEEASSHPSVSICLAVPFTAISSLEKFCTESEGSQIRIGAQNMHDVAEGAYTGEISGKMLVDAGASFVLLGHSERRHLFGESNEWIHQKVKKALKDRLQPVLCIGETLQERKEGRREEVLKEQLIQGCGDLSTEELHHMIIAYEPVWAIGSGLVPKAEEVEKIHIFCRKIAEEVGSREWAENLTIQYGGSVKESNVASFMEQKNIDGLLVGGASLSPDSFQKIIDIAVQVKTS